MTIRLVRFVAICSIILLSGCSNSSDYSGRYEAEKGSPYDISSGHGAGYEWVERTGSSCNGNSTSFNEGCEEYYRQQGQ